MLTTTAVVCLFVQSMTKWLVQLQGKDKHLGGMYRTLASVYGCDEGQMIDFLPHPWRSRD
jgi:hypothetical protein